MECFLKKYLVSEQRQQPTDSIEANMWLIKYVEELPHRGSKRAEPKPTMCTQYQAGPKTPQPALIYSMMPGPPIVHQLWLYNVAHSPQVACAHATLI